MADSSGKDTWGTKLNFDVTKNEFSETSVLWEISAFSLQESFTLWKILTTIMNNLKERLCVSASGSENSKHIESSK